MVYNNIKYIKEIKDANLNINGTYNLICDTYNLSINLRYLGGFENKACEHNGKCTWKVSQFTHTHTDSLFGGCWHG